MSEPEELMDCSQVPAPGVQSLISTYSPSKLLTMVFFLCLRSSTTVQGCARLCQQTGYYDHPSCGTVVKIRAR